MNQDTNIKLPIKITRNGHVDWPRMAYEYGKLAFTILDYACVHNKLPSINR